MKAVKGCLTWLALSVVAILILGIIIASRTPRDNAALLEPTHTVTPAPTFTLPPVVATEPPTLATPLPLIEATSAVVDLIPTTTQAIIATATNPPAQPASEQPTLAVPLVEPTSTVAELVPTLELVVIPTVTSPPTQSATAANTGNLRSGPGTDWPIVGSVTAGQALTIIARNAAGDWYQLSDGTWIAAFLVTNAPPNAAVVEVSATEQPTDMVIAPTSAPVVVEPIAEPVTAQPNNSSFTCAGGCAQPPDPSCDIKGNFNGNDGDKIFHQKGGRWYDDTDVILSEGDVWFCTVDEARAAGYREAGSR